MFIVSLVQISIMKRHSTTVICHIIKCATAHTHNAHTKIHAHIHQLQKTSWLARQDAKLVTSHFFEQRMLRPFKRMAGILLLIIVLLIWPILVSCVSVTLEAPYLVLFIVCSFVGIFLANPDPRSHL